jgi:hypothetical protein
MSRVPLEFVQSSVGAYLVDGLPEELSNFVTSEVNYLALFCLVYRNGHVIWMIQLPGTSYQSHCTAHGAYFRSITLCCEGNRLAVLAVLLYPSGNLDKTGSLEGITIQFFDDTLPLIVEDEVVGNESFDYQKDKCDN